MKLALLLVLLTTALSGMSAPVAVRSDPADVVPGGVRSVCAESATTCDTRGPYELETAATWFSGMPIGFLLFLK